MKVTEIAGKSVSSRFSVQSIDENGDIKSSTEKNLNQIGTTQNFIFEEPTNSTESNQRLPIITEDVSFA